MKETTDNKRRAPSAKDQQKRKNVYKPLSPPRDKNSRNVIKDDPQNVVKAIWKEYRGSVNKDDPRNVVKDKAKWKEYRGSPSSSKQYISFCRPPKPPPTKSAPPKLPPQKPAPPKHSPRPPNSKCSVPYQARNEKPSSPKNRVMYVASSKRNATPEPLILRQTKPSSMKLWGFNNKLIEPVSTYRSIVSRFRTRKSDNKAVTASFTKICVANKGFVRTPPRTVSEPKQTTRSRSYSELLSRSKASNIRSNDRSNESVKSKIKCQRSETGQHPAKRFLKRQVWKISKPFIKRNKRLSSLFLDSRVNIDKINIDAIDHNVININALGIENKALKRGISWLLK